MKKWMIVAVLAAIAVAALAPVASAAEVDDGHRVTLEGRGALWAAGFGRVEVSGAGTVRLAVKGDVSIVDHAGDARIRVAGLPPADDTALTLEDFRGVVRITGSDFTVVAEGRILLRAAGRGTALLEGTGRYRVHHDGWGLWADPGVEVPYPA